MAMVRRHILSVLSVLGAFVAFAGHAQAIGNGWTLGCDSTNECRLANEVTAPDTGLTTRLELTLGETGVAMTIMTPLGIDLPSGATLQVDAGRILSIAAKTCEGYGCIFLLAPDKELMTAFQNGAQAHLQFYSADKNVLFKMTHQMTGFGSNFKALEKISKP